ncbi:MAG: DUF2726 domain-containing protein [Betaproteobacteria bacterium]
MTEILLAVLAAVALIGVVWWRRRAQETPDDKSGRSLDGLDTLTAWEPQATRVLSTAERLAYGVLVRALPDYIVFAQVPLSRFIRVPTRHSYAEWLQRVGQLAPDLLVCDSSSQVVCAVDIQPPGALQSERARKRQERVRRVLKAADIQLHVWVEGALPTPEAAREQLFPKPKVPELTSTQPPVAQPQPAPARAAAAKKALTPEDLEFEPDEVIEMREPPPSTWFDNFDTKPAPLRPVAPQRPAATGPAVRPPAVKAPTPR